MSRADGGAPDFGALALAPFRPEHGADVVALLRAVYAEYGQVVELDALDDDLPRIAEVYAAPNRFEVLLDGEQVVGTVALKWHEPERAELKRVFLDRRLRGRGLGRRLVEVALGWARAGGARTLDIWSDVLFEEAHALYRRLGAADPGRVRTLGGRNEIRERYFRLDLDVTDPGGARPRP